MASFNREFFFPEPPDDLPFPDPRTSLDPPHEDFQDFMQCINALYYHLTNCSHKLNGFGMDPRQQDLVHLTRYTLYKLREAFREHPLYIDLEDDMYD